MDSQGHKEMPSRIYLYGGDHVNQLSAFGVTVTAGDYGLGALFGSEAKACVGAQVKLSVRPEQVRPEQVTLHLRAETQDEISPFAVHREETYEYAKDLTFPLPINILWGRGKGGVWTPGLPDWREEKTFVNVVIFHPQDGFQFDDIQVSLVGREGQLYTMVQQVYAARVREVDGSVTFIPSHSFYARPGMDPRQVWKVRGRALALIGSCYAQVVASMAEPLSVPEPAKWTPPQAPSQIPDGWVFATVAHYNPITDSGLAIGNDGEEFQLLGRYLNGFPGPVMVPVPMSGVLLKTTPKKEGYKRTLATSCRPCP